jgi:hypothetical protein
VGDNTSKNFFEKAKGGVLLLFKFFFEKKQRGEYCLLKCCFAVFVGVKWLCAECVPSSEESEVDSMDGGLEGRKRRTLQGQNPLRLKRNDLGALLPAIPGHKKRGRKPGFRVQKKIKTEVEATPIKAEHEEKELGEVATVSPRPSGRKARTVEEKSGSCVKCQTGCTSKTAVECDRCTNWYHFATCLDPPCKLSLSPGPSSFLSSLLPFLPKLKFFLPNFRFALPPRSLLRLALRRL